MLETKNLRKTYRTKKGVQVEALKGISLKFPEKGMVFLLGKSGSGKSTLLNLLGGLDSYDQGELIIKGVSSKDFSQSQFDSYRNTYVGFIFQEYNVLEEFSVGANIALAIELQGRKASDSEINQILKRVDLEGVGDRKPNELSGGQKQRVAIARALVKNPQIIMADEPTGALDSNTGRQVLETLKKLSDDKLVIVVSHDREFAEKYGDRIIELADGAVIRDVESQTEKDGEQTQQGLSFLENEIVFAEGYHLTEEDRILINEYLAGRKKKVKAVVKNSQKGGFKETDQTGIAYTKQDFKLIRSKLPMKNAFKMGVSALKHKKIRLVMTILLSFIAFSLFALADTFGSYDNEKTCTRSIVDSKVNYAAFSKNFIAENEYGHYSAELYFKKDEIKDLQKKSGLNFQGVLPCDAEIENYDLSVALSEGEDTSSYATFYSGFMAMTDETLKEYGYELAAGKLPEGGQKQAAITTYLFETFRKAGYCAPGSKKAEPISAYEDMIGKKIQVGKSVYEVSGVVDVQMDFSRYEKINQNTDNVSTAERLEIYALRNEIYQIQFYSTAGALMVSPQTMEELAQNEIKTMTTMTESVSLFDENSELDFYVDSFTTLSEIDEKDVVWFDKNQTALHKDEVILPLRSLQEYGIRSKKEAVDFLKKNPTLSYAVTNDFGGEQEEEQEVKIAGIYDDAAQSENAAEAYILADNLMKPEWKKTAGSYNYAVAPMPKDEGEINKLVKINQEKLPETDTTFLQYSLCNSVVYELDAVDEILKSVSKAFLYIGIGFAVFAALMLANFIATSISYKKQEIGILRAIGARSSDVFRIFFSESFVIALVNFILACAAAAMATRAINNFVRFDTGILITILNFGVRQILLLLLLSILIAWIASFLPVYRIARKKPVDAIRNK